MPSPEPASAASPRRVPGGAAGAHLLVAALGTALLAWDAAPMEYDGFTSTVQPGLWTLMFTSAAVFGCIGGLLEGAALATGHRTLAGQVLLGASVPALWMPSLALGRWFPDQDEAALGTSYLVAPVLGWLLFVGVLPLVAALVAAPRRPGA